MLPDEMEQVKKFTRKASLFCLPFILLIAMNLLLDPFKIWFDYDDYYKNSFVTLNRSFVCLKLFDRNVEKVGYNSFIFGNSRSQAFTVPEWERRLGPGSTGFHFDSFSEGIYGIYTKIRYIKDGNHPIKDVLIVMDHDVMVKTQDHGNHVFIYPPKLTGGSAFSFYFKFLRANLDPEFIVGYLDYRCFHKYRGYMERLFNDPGVERIYDNRTGDLAHLNERLLKKDEEGYYAGLAKKRVFFDRSKMPPRKEPPISGEEKRLLQGIRDSMVESGARYKIVVSPLYDQIKLSDQRLALLKGIFGAENVFDFSGANRFTGPIHNYYETMHYRPHVANEIMDIVYGRPLRKGR